MNKIWTYTGLFCCIVLALCFAYPYLFSLYIDYYCAKQLPKYDPATNGTFGDMFGGLNTVFSGLAFVGLIATIAVQIYLYNLEKNDAIVKEAKKEEGYIMNKLIYFTEITKAFLIENGKFAKSIEDWIKANDGSISKNGLLKPITKNISDSIYDLLNNKINQEEIFLSYKSKVENNDIMKLFLDIDRACQYRKHFFDNLEIHIATQTEIKSEHYRYYVFFSKNIDFYRTNTIVDEFVRRIMQKEDIYLSKDIFLEYHDKGILEFFSSEMKDNYMNLLVEFNKLEYNKSEFIDYIRMYPSILIGLNEEIGKRNQEIIEILK